MVLANATANATINGTDLLSNDGTPNGIFIHSIFQYLGGGGVISDSIIFWVFALLVFIISFEVFSRFFLDMKKSTKILLSFLAPLLLDLLISFGRFDFYIPIINQTYTIERGVMFLTMLDNIFTYKFFVYYTSGILDPFISAASVTDSSMLMYLGTLLYASIDSIVEFTFLSWLIYSLITIYEDYTQEKIEYQLPIAVIVALIPVLFYSIFVSNPFTETDEMIKTFNGLSAFVQSGQTFDIIFVIMLFIINLLLMATIVFVVIELVFSLYSKVYYGRKEIEYVYDYAGMGLMYSIAYSFIFFLHSEYKWYVFFPMMVVYSYFRKATSNVVDGAKVRIDEKNKMNKLTGMALERSRNEYASETSVTSRRRKELNGDEFDMKYIIVSILLVIIAIVIFYYYFGGGLGI